MKKLLIIALIGAIVFVGCKATTISSSNEGIQETNEINIIKQEQENNIISMERMIKTLNQDVEFILVKEQGAHKINHEKIPNASKFTKWLSHSNIEIENNYQAIISILTKNINIRNTHGILCIDYNIDDIQIRSIEIIKTIPIYDKALFGQKYTNEELLALIEISKEEIYNQLTNDEELKNTCIINLNNTLREIAAQCGVEKIIINNEYMSLI